MFSLSKPIDAVKKLNEDFGLHIEIGKVPTAEEVSEYQKWIAEKRAYEVWEKSAWKTLQEYLCDEFIRADNQGKISMKNIVSEIADYMEKSEQNF